MAIQKVKVEVTILMEAESLEIATAVVDSMDLADIAYDITDGEWVGEIAVSGVETVPPHRVRDELIALGNDGEFFGEIED